MGVVDVESHVYLLPDSNLVYQYSTDGINWQNINNATIDTIFLNQSINANQTLNIYIKITVDNPSKGVNALSQCLFILTPHK